MLPRLSGMRSILHDKESETSVTRTTEKAFARTRPILRTARWLRKAHFNGKVRGSPIRSLTTPETRSHRQRKCTPVPIGGEAFSAGRIIAQSALLMELVTQGEAPNERAETKSRIYLGECSPARSAHHLRGSTGKKATNGRTMFLGDWLVTAPQLEHGIERGLKRGEGKKKVKSH